MAGCARLVDWWKSVRVGAGGLKRGFPALGLAISLLVCATWFTLAVSARTAEAVGQTTTVTLSKTAVTVGQTVTATVMLTNSTSDTTYYIMRSSLDVLDLQGRPQDPASPVLTVTRVASSGSLGPKSTQTETYVARALGPGTVKLSYNAQGESHNSAGWYLWGTGATSAPVLVTGPAATPTSGPRVFLPLILRRPGPAW